MERRNSLEFAKNKNAILADHKRQHSTSYSLSPTSLLAVKKEEKIVLSSPNGSTLSLSAGSAITLCGCLRNAKAVADYALTAGKKIALVLPASNGRTGVYDHALKTS